MKSVGQAACQSLQQRKPRPAHPEPKPKQLLTSTLYNQVKQEPSPQSRLHLQIGTHGAQRSHHPHPHLPPHRHPHPQRERKEFTCAQNTRRQELKASLVSYIHAGTEELQSLPNTRHWLWMVPSLSPGPQHLWMHPHWCQQDHIRSVSSGTRQ